MMAITYRAGQRLVAKALRTELAQRSAATRKGRELEYPDAE